MADPRTTLQEAIAALLCADDPAGRSEAQRAAVAAIARFAETPIAPKIETAAAVESEQDLLRDFGGVLQSVTDTDLATFNRALPWGAISTDVEGRPIGMPWSGSKRAVAQRLVDKRQRQFDDAFPLRGKRVLEVGCFEGLHTLGLIRLGAEVTAIDSRIENVLKTLARLWIYGQSARTLLWNLEGDRPPTAPADWDVLHHIGVLYHLSDPAGHLLEFLPRTHQAVILDTHVATGLEDVSDSYRAGGRDFRFTRKVEVASNPFAGMEDHAKWLLPEDLVSIMVEAGFKNTRIVDDRSERNGRRVMIWAFR